MLAFSINLPSDVQAQINSFSAQYSVDSLVASAIAQVSSGGQQFFPDGGLVVTPFGVGVMGIGKDRAQSLGFDATEQIPNIQAGVAYLALLLQAFIGNYPKAIAAYVTSQETVLTFNGIPPLAPVTSFVYNVSKIAANAGSISVSGLLSMRNESSVDPLQNNTGNLIDPRTHGTNYGSGVSAATSAQNRDQTNASIEPVLQVEDASLSNTPWYKDTGLLTGNSRIRASVQPVTFSVFFDRNDPNQFLKNPADNTPIELQLNTSLSSFEISSKHVYNRTPSRTGMHVTLWGMEPDLISGQGSTGVFMNQFGLTDFMSTSGITDDIIKLLTSGFAADFSPTFDPFDSEVAIQDQTTSAPIGSQANNFGEQTTPGFALISTNQQTSTGTASIFPVTGDPKNAQDIIARQNLKKPSEAFRVAAQDAFIEFMKLFQMNGNVWFYSQSYANGGRNGTNLGLIGQQQQESPTAWSKKTGATSFQQHARNNDVMTRGFVQMRYRNNIYLGYFKTLSWTQDAENPFQWKFNFSFQVEKTYTALYFPQPGVTLNQNFGINGARSLSDGPQEA
jgi:hypothetical protein